MTAIKQILMYENERIEDFYPFNILHCAWELRTGAFRQFERIQKLYQDAKMIFNGRDLQRASFFERFELKEEFLVDESVLKIDSAVVFNRNIKEKIDFYIEKNIGKDLVFQKNNHPIAFYIHTDSLNKLNNFTSQSNNEFVICEIDDAQIINYLWDTLDIVGDEIKNDFAFYNINQKTKFDGVFLINEDNISIGENVKIMPNCVLDASKGNIIVEDNVTIMAQSTILGPCFIGRNSTIKIGAKIYENSAIGEFCKIGGELENSIFQSYSNKQHEGFLGHSFISEWVNLGADTNNSDLKNTYSEIKMRLPHKTVKTGRIFLGLMCGDHTKTAINTQFNTGTVAGICGVLFDSGFLSTTIPSFAWGGLINSKKYNLSEALSTTEKVMKRRSKTLSDSEILLIKNEYDKK